MQCFSNGYFDSVSLQIYNMEFVPAETHGRRVIKCTEERNKGRDNGSRVFERVSSARFP
jgi:hypothetical protein